MRGRRFRALMTSDRVNIVLLLLCGAALAVLAWMALEDFADYTGMKERQLGPFVFWATVASWPLTTAALVIYRRHTQPPVGPRASVLWWFVIAWLPWSWLLIGLVPRALMFEGARPLHWLRHATGWLGIFVAAGCGVVALLLWLWRTRRPPADGGFALSACAVLLLTRLPV